MQVAAVMPAPAVKAEAAAGHRRLSLALAWQQLLLAAPSSSAHLLHATTGCGFKQFASAGAHLRRLLKAEAPSAHHLRQIHLQSPPMGIKYIQIKILHSTCEYPPPPPDPPAGQREVIKLISKGHCKCQPPPPDPAAARATDREIQRYQPQLEAHLKAASCPHRASARRAGMPAGLHACICIPSMPPCYSGARRRVRLCLRTRARHLDTRLCGPPTAHVQPPNLSTCTHLCLGGGDDARARVEALQKGLQHGALCAGKGGKRACMCEERALHSLGMPCGGAALGLHVGAWREMQAASGNTV